MNFKLTKGKAVISITIPVALWVSLFFMSQVVLNGENTPFFIIRFLGMHNLNNLFSFGNISIFLIEVLAIYLILSIFQKKKKSPSRQAQPNPSQQSSPSQSLAPSQS
jgi:hypothetical protein